MRLLGIDPGIATVGFGMLTVTPDGVFEDPQWGVIRTSKDKQDALRLQEIHEDLTQLLMEYQPDQVVVESLFFFKNAKTMVPVCQARGVILLALSQGKIPIAEYTPMQVKQAITGYGKATKEEVQTMLLELLSLEKLPRPDDAADALAMTICHYYQALRTEMSVPVSG